MMILKLYCAYGHLGNLVETQLLTQQVGAGLRNGISNKLRG